MTKESPAWEVVVEAHGEAPGRVNLIGEHTDYNDGFVLPTTLPLKTRVAASRRQDNIAELISEESDPVSVTFVIGEEDVALSWGDYVKGAVVALRRAGVAIGGFTARISSEVPRGAGLSSSAALVVAVLRALRALFRLTLDDLAIGRLAHEAETTFVGVPVGVMDPLAASLGRPGVALFVDTRSMDIEHVAIPASDLVVVDSGVHHAHRGGEYAARRAECEIAARALGVSSLREATEEMVAKSEALFGRLRRRARHVVSENLRVLAAVSALKRGDLRRVGELFYESHESLRADFEVTVDAVDALVWGTLDDDRVYGARMTGGGFGGAVIALARAGDGVDVARQMLEGAMARGDDAARIVCAGGAK